LLGQQTSGAAIQCMSKKIAVYRKEHFNAAHRLHNNALSDAENAALFGKCNYPNYHGHNYELVVKVTGEIDPKTGYVIDLKLLGDLVKKYVIERFDHKNLNLDTEEFRQLNPTAENIALVIHDILRKQLDARYELKILLYETERNYVEYPL
jgi:6-pyruvoyltetrahydropterin/6-carboxytetrahydropterin synthase